MANKGGYYYLHTNGDLIWKPEIVVDTDPQYFDSPFVKHVWRVPADSDRDVPWTLLLESLAMGANLDRVKELANKWGCDGKDLPTYMAAIGPKPNPAMRKGIRIFLQDVLGVDPDAWFDWLAATPTGTEPDFSTMPTAPVPQGA